MVAELRRCLDLADCTRHLAGKRWTSEDLKKLRCLFLPTSWYWKKFSHLLAATAGAAIVEDPIRALIVPVDSTDGIKTIRCLDSGLPMTRKVFKCLRETFRGLFCSTAEALRCAILTSTDGRVGQQSVSSRQTTVFNATGAFWRPEYR